MVYLFGGALKGDVLPAYYLTFAHPWLIIPLMIKPAKNSKFYRKAIYVTAGILATAAIVVSIHLLITTLIPNTERKDRIEAIYSSLDLGSDYALTSANVFGEKRVYEWDTGRTYSSVKEYVKDSTVSETATELKAKIERAGFAFFDEPYAGSLDIQYHFKSTKNEYIRMSVSSKPRDDAFRKDGPSTTSEATLALDPNAGPSNVIIKVNLDDNNE